MPASQNTRDVTLDMHPIAVTLAEALAAIASMDGYKGPVDFDQGRGPRHNDPRQAEMSRTLLRTSELLRMAASELQMHYWTLKGWDDPRFED